ncbi:MAG: sulfatase [Roseiflexaceae bacterium]
MTLPNILYIHSHDTGRMVQPYGAAVATPHIQRLAEQGTLFRQAFSMAPTCSPSRAALLTGQAPHSAGMLGLAHRGFDLSDTQQHLVHTLKSVGYHTALVGIQHVARDPATIGYDQILTLPNSHAMHVAPAAAAFLQAPPTTPFFLDVGFFETHREFPPADQPPNYTAPPPGLPDTPETRADMAAYHASAHTLDQGIGQVLAALDANGLTEQTLIICTTDHGIAFPGSKCTLTDRGIGVMLILGGIALVQGGRVIDSLVSQIDLFPTICELIGMAPPAWLQGRSLVPLLNKTTTQINQSIYAEVSYHAAYEPQRAIRTYRWKYIRRYGSRRTPVLPNCDDSPSKDVLLANGWAEQNLPTEQLYDLAFDPHEANNLAESPDHAAILADLRVQLHEWMRSTDDPLLAGYVPAPAGVVVNNPAGISPNEPTRPAVQ